MKLTLLFSLLAVLSVVVFVAPDISDVQEKMLQGHWTTINATVDSVRVVRTSETRSKVIFSTLVDYRYTFNDNEYRGSDVAQRNEVLPAPATDEHVIANKRLRFPKGMSVALRVDISHPEHSWVSTFHERQLAGVLMGIAGAVLFVVLAIVVALRTRARSNG